MDGVSRQEGLRLAERPRLVAGSIERGHRVPTLPARHVEIALRFIPGRDREALGRSLIPSLDARRVIGAR